MPNKIATNTRNMLYLKLVALLKTITHANGYNTQPRICDDQEEADSAQEQHTVWVKVADEAMDDSTLGGHWHCVCDFVVFGLVRQDESDLTTDTNALLQDIRTVITAYRASFPTTCNGASMAGFDTCETDQGALASAGKSFFVQPVAFEYVAGPTW
ncbi:MAG TPA: hypothetical protein VM487_14055 [Phycisphaerae bacterium]|nr:hypothetical protein [Phycisphaerae bacterium]